MDWCAPLFALHLLHHCKGTVSHEAGGATIHLVGTAYVSIEPDPKPGSKSSGQFFVEVDLLALVCALNLLHQCK